MRANILLTGPSGSGKSTLAKRLVSKGWAYLDGDQLAKSLYTKASLRSALKKAFGPEVLRPDGSLNNVWLGEIVFSSLVHRRRLQRLVFPQFERALRQRLRALRPLKRAVVADVAVYFAMGAPKLGLPVVLVQAPLGLRIQRLRKRGLSAERAKAQARALRFAAPERRRCLAVLDGRKPLPQLERALLRALSVESAA